MSMLKPFGAVAALFSVVLIVALSLGSFSRVGKDDGAADGGPLGTGVNFTISNFSHNEPRCTAGITLVPTHAATLESQAPTAVPTMGPTVELLAVDVEVTVESGTDLEVIQQQLGDTLRNFHLQELQEIYPNVVDIVVDVNAASSAQQNTLLFSYTTAPYHTVAPTVKMSQAPSEGSVPTGAPSNKPSAKTLHPSLSPTTAPSKGHTSSTPSLSPSSGPSSLPSNSSPTSLPTDGPSALPSRFPSHVPSFRSVEPSNEDSACNSISSTQIRTSHASFFFSDTISFHFEPTAHVVENVSVNGTIRRHQLHPKSLSSQCVW